MDGFLQHLPIASRINVSSAYFDDVLLVSWSIGVALRVASQYANVVLVHTTSCFIKNSRSHRVSELKRTMCITNMLSIILVDPASSHMLVSKIKPCMSKYKLYLIVKPQKAQYNSYYLFDYKNSYLDNCGNSRANTCKQHDIAVLAR